MCRTDSSSSSYAVETATQGILDHDRSPSRKVGEPDNRDSHYWFARYWAEALATQTEDTEISAHFAPISSSVSPACARDRRQTNRCQNSQTNNNMLGTFHK